MVPFLGTKNGPFFLRAVYKYVRASLFLEPKQVPKTGTKMVSVLQKYNKKSIKLYVLIVTLSRFSCKSNGSFVRKYPIFAAHRRLHLTHHIVCAFLVFPPLLINLAPALVSAVFSASQ